MTAVEEEVYDGLIERVKGEVEAERPAAFDRLLSRLLSQPRKHRPVVGG